MLSADAAQVSVSALVEPSARALIAVAELLQIETTGREQAQEKTATILCQDKSRNKGGRRETNELRAAGEKRTRKRGRAGAKGKTRAGSANVNRDRSRLSSRKRAKR